MSQRDGGGAYHPTLAHDARCAVSTIGFSAMKLRPGEGVRPPARSSSAVFHVIEGERRSTINGETFLSKRSDTFSAPVFARIEHTASGHESALLVRNPLQQKLGFYEERPAA
jgi:gentisate 1,2-dioxygenase